MVRNDAASLSQRTDLSLVLGRFARRSMHLGYTYILLSLLSYSSLGILHKVAEVKNCRALSISLAMCAWCLVFLLVVIAGRGKSVHAPLTVVTLALPFGISAGIAILALQTALSFGNISTSWLAVNLSAGIPTVLSIVLYKEPITWLKVFALVTMAISMVLLWKDSQLRKAALVSTDS
jgi:EamA domain-containing membrane protein RarD